MTARSSRGSARSERVGVDDKAGRVSVKREGAVNGVEVNG